jgi:hypothetical protein
MPSVLVHHNCGRLVDQPVPATDDVIKRRQVVASHGDGASAKCLVKTTAFTQKTRAKGHVGT